MRERRSAVANESSSKKSRFWISVMFDCCHVYQRVTFRPGRKRAVARCPKCLRIVTFEISPDGTADRFYVAGD